MRSRKSSPNTDRYAIPDISDEIRVTMARDVINQLNADLASSSFQAYASSAAILNQLKSPNLVSLAN